MFASIAFITDKNQVISRYFVFLNKHRKTGTARQCALNGGQCARNRVGWGTAAVLLIFIVDHETK